MMEVGWDLVAAMEDGEGGLAEDGPGGHPSSWPHGAARLGVAAEDIGGAVGEERTWAG